MSADKLNAVANFFSGLLADGGKKKKKPIEGSDEEEALESKKAEADEEAPAKRLQKSIRKNMGGEKEPS